jgi:hypothetical protein
VVPLRPDDRSFRGRVHRWPGPEVAFDPGVRMFELVQPCHPKRVVWEVVGS